jgi:hypothetical protein
MFGVTMSIEGSPKSQEKTAEPPGAVPRLFRFTTSFAISCKMFVPERIKVSLTVGLPSPFPSGLDEEGIELLAGVYVEDIIGDFHGTTLKGSPTCSTILAEIMLFSTIATPPTFLLVLS